MRSLDRLTWHVMNAMADDWESIVQIRRDLHPYFDEISDEQIVSILRHLHGEKLVEIMAVPGQTSETFLTHPESC
jgi:hypothetical protein